jgi:hypothetical protein
MLNVTKCLTTALAVLFGSLLTLYLYPPVQLTVAGQAWCYVGEYKTLNEVPPLPHSLVDVTSKGVRVFGECE